jgi:very-short-patch-repair endonuclease
MAPISANSAENGATSDFFPFGARLAPFVGMSAKPVDKIAAKLAVCAAGRLGLFTRFQARHLGLSDDQLDRRAAAGIYERLGGGVFAVAGAPNSWERRALAGLLGVGPLARLSHRAAAHVLGFDGFGECPIEVTVPRGMRSRTRLAVVHRTTYLHPLDGIRVGRFPVTSGARTIIDLCAVGATEDELSASMGSAARDGYTSEIFLRKRLADMRGPGRHGIRIIDRVLEGPIAHSHLERVFLRLVREAGIDVPETQITIRGERVMRVDCIWEDAKVIDEVMGHRFHVTREDLQRDAQRRDELQELGYMVIEFTASALATRPVQCMAQLRRNLIRRRALLASGTDLRG